MKKPIAIHFTDLHLSDDTAESCADIMRQLVELALSLGVTIIFNGGDTFNTRKSQSLTSLLAFQDFLDYFEENGLKMVSIDGNHDKLDYKSSFSYMDVYVNHKCFHLVKEQSRLGFKEFNSVNISMLSFFSDDNQCTSNKIFVDHLNAISKKVVKSDRKEILITHHGINGAKSNSGLSIESDISSKLFDKFDTVLVGHYHDGNDLTKKIKYTGSCRQAWFDENKEKGFTIIYDDGSTEFRKAVFKEYTELRVVLTDNYVEKVSAAVKKLNTTYKDDFKRINLVGDRAAIKSIDISRIKSSGIDVRTTDITNPVEQSVEMPDAGHNYVIFNESDFINLFMEFTDEEGLLDDDIEYGVEILGRTINNNKLK